VTADGLQLVAALPQLAPGAELEFQLGDTGSRRLGRIERIDVKPRSEHGALELSVRLQPSAATTRSRRNLVYGFGDGESIEYTPPSPTPPRPAQSAAIIVASTADDSSALTTTTRIERRRDRTHTIQIPKTSAMRFVRWGLALAAVGGAAVWLVNLAIDGESRQRHAESELETEAAEESTSVSAATSTSSANHTAAHVEQPPAATKPIETIEVPAPSASIPLAPRPTTIATTPAPAPQDSATKLQTSASPATAIADEARLPALNSEDGKSEIFVPMQGSLDGLRTTQWTDPLAVVLDIPGAHFTAPELLKGLRGGGVKRVRLDETRPVPRLQIFLNTVAARFAAKSVPHGLLVVLEHDLRPLPH
jgi:hypothetical protein